jgi:hypothetical protein
MVAPPPNRPPPTPPSASYLETEMGSHSLPTVEEAHTQGTIHAGGSMHKGTGNRYSGKNKRTIALVAILVAVISLTVGFTIAFVQNHRGRSSSGNSNSLNSENDSDDSVDEARLQKTHIFLLGTGISAEVDLKDPSKPQYQAALWMADKDDAQLDIPETFDYDLSFEFVQRYVMTVFYYALDGPNWTQQMNFLSSDGVCDWNYNIEVKDSPPGTDDTNFDFGVSCYDEETADYTDVVTYIFICTLPLPQLLE